MNSFEATRRHSFSKRSLPKQREQNMMQAKSKAVVRLQLLGDPMDISSSVVYDPDMVDLSPAHVKEMQQKLYGQRNIVKSNCGVTDD